MKHSSIVLFTFVIVACVIAKGQNDGCGDLTINLPNKNYTLTFPAGGKKFTATTDCTITVKSFKNMDFTFTVTTINFHDSTPCDANFIAADPDQLKVTSGPVFKVCDTDTVKKANAPKGKTIYLRIKTTSVTQDTKEPTVTLNFISTQGDECGTAVIQLEKAIQNVTLPAPTTSFTVNSDCDIQVNAFDGKEFKMSIPEITFSNGNCMDSYVAASTDKAQIEKATYKKCGTKAVTETITSQSNMLFLKVVTGKIDPPPKVTFMFETIFQECGAYEIEFNGENKDVSLPVTGTFSSKTECVLKVTGVNGSKFQLTIPEITFNDNCETNYVSASDTRFGLPNNNYKHCGTTAVTTPFESKDGTMFVLIKTGNGDAKTAVKLHFQSGANKLKPFALAAVLIFKFVSNFL